MFPSGSLTPPLLTTFPLVVTIHKHLLRHFNFHCCLGGVDHTCLALIHIDGRPITKSISVPSLDNDLAQGFRTYVVQQWGKSITLLYAALDGDKPPGWSSIASWSLVWRLWVLFIMYSSKYSRILGLLVANSSSACTDLSCQVEFEQMPSQTVLGALHLWSLLSVPSTCVELCTLSSWLPWCLTWAFMFYWDSSWMGMHPFALPLRLGLSDVQLIIPSWRVDSFFSH